MRSRRIRRPDTTWWQMLVLAGVAMLLVGCSDYRLLANLKDNPMDQAIATGAPGSDLEETRERLLKRFPVGQPVAPVIRYLKSVGASCRNSQGSSETVTCRYFQKMDLVFSTPVGESLEIRDTFDFHIDLKHRRGVLWDARVCLTITVIRYRGTLTNHKNRTKYPIKCSREQNRKGK